MTALPLTRLTTHIYISPPHEETDRPVLGAIVGEKSVLMVEAGNSPAHAHSFLEALARQHIARPSYAVLTHWHWDHIFGASALSRIQIFAHTKTAQAIQILAKLDWSDEAIQRRVADGKEIAFCRDCMRQEFTDSERKDIRLRHPDITFNTRIEIDLGSVSANLIHVGGDHSADSVVIFIPQDGVVFLGDCIYDAIYDTPRNYTSAKLFALLERLTALDASLYLPAHQETPISRSEFLSLAKKYKTIGSLVDQHGDDRQAILTHLSHLSIPNNEETVTLIDLFIAGRQKPVSASPISFDTPPKGNR
ncbi:MAG: MBL fold metallo-hydrolase [Anaerolineae bacterium]|nr:MBL fold metallo-hydrolase [Anaerolineae bacterium]